MILTCEKCGEQYNEFNAIHICGATVTEVQPCAECAEKDKRIEELGALIDRTIEWDDEDPSTAAGYKSIIADMRKAREGRE